MKSPEERIRAVVAHPHELDAYREWLAGQRAPAERDYLFAEERPRFEPRKDDVAVVVPGVSMRELKLPSGVSKSEAARIVGAIDGERCLVEVQLDAGVAPDVLARFLRATFGLVVLAPRAVEALEAKLPGVEITRFPTVPYAIVRSYWENMIAVAERVPDRVPEGEAFLELLAELHVVALMGASLDSFYKPASPGADDRVAPGALFDEPPRVRETGRAPIFISGPRVNAALLGGEGYHRALYQSLGDPGGLDRQEELTDAGLAWGRVIMARSERDPAAKAWFCPPRPLRHEHFAALRAELERAFSGPAEEAVAAAARFHWCFVRLHPFRCANQSLAMSLVGAALRRHRGMSIPHLILDHVALRATRDAYVELFSRAVAAFSVDEAPARRLAALRAQQSRANALIAKLGPELDDAAARALIAADPDAARFALLS